MFFGLDTDHMSALEWGSGGVGQRLIARLNSLPVGEAATTIITFEEQTRGWLSVLARSRSLDEQVEAYRRLKRLLGNYLKIEVEDLAQSPLRREFVLLKRSWGYWAKGNELCYFFDDHPDLLSQVQILENYGLVRDITYNNVHRYVMSEELAQYLCA
jgi:hypothetical protein